MWMPANDYIPHEKSMRFIDVICENTGGCVAKGVVRDDNPLLTEEGLPAHVGIEYMAQAIAGQRGIAQQDSAKKGGVIVNIKAVQIARSHFAVGEEIEIFIESLHRDATFEVNRCVAVQGEQVIEAEISVAEINDD